MCLRSCPTASLQKRMIVAPSRRVVIKNHVDDFIANQGPRQLMVGHIGRLLLDSTLLCNRVVLVRPSNYFAIVVVIISKLAWYKVKLRRVFRWLARRKASSLSLHTPPPLLYTALVISLQEAVSLTSSNSNVLQHSQILLTLQPIYF